MQAHPGDAFLHLCTDAPPLNTTKACSPRGFGLVEHLGRAGLRLPLLHEPLLTRPANVNLLQLRAQLSPLLLDVCLEPCTAGVQTTPARLTDLLRLESERSPTATQNPKRPCDRRSEIETTWNMANKA